jgi:hypothetical protein
MFVWQDYLYFYTKISTFFVAYYFNFFSNSVTNRRINSKISLSSSVSISITIFISFFHILLLLHTRMVYYIWSISYYSLFIPMCFYVSRTFCDPNYSLACASARGLDRVFWRFFSICTFLYTFDLGERYVSGDK